MEKHNKNEKIVYVKGSTARNNIIDCSGSHPDVHECHMIVIKPTPDGGNSLTVVPSPEGAITGAGAGAAAGNAFFGPPGAVVGALVGGVVGLVLGPATLPPTKGNETGTAMPEKAQAQTSNTVPTPRKIT